MGCANYFSCPGVEGMGRGWHATNVTCSRFSTAYPSPCIDFLPCSCHVVLSGVDQRTETIPCRYLFPNDIWQKRWDSTTFSWDFSRWFRVGYAGNPEAFPCTCYHLLRFEANRFLGYICSVKNFLSCNSLLYPKLIVHSRCWNARRQS